MQGIKLDWLHTVLLLVIAIFLLLHVLNFDANISNFLLDSSADLSSVELRHEVDDSTALSATSGKLFSGEKLFSYDGPLMFQGETSLVMNSLRASFSNGNTTQKSVAMQKDDLICDKWAVVTTIFPPTEAVRKQARVRDWCLVVVGDRKGPASYPIPAPYNGRVVFLSAARQEGLMQLLQPLAQLLPWNHFGRKNVGYLYALLHGARFIFDFDDDNLHISEEGSFPWPGAWSPTNNGSSDVIDGNLTTVTVARKATALAVNPLLYMGSIRTPSWPRGFPLEFIKYNYTHYYPDGNLKHSLKHLLQLSRANATAEATLLHTNLVILAMNQIGVVQYLANHDPDVDAIFRLTQLLPLNYPSKHADGSNVLPFTVPSGGGAYSPYNAQATLHMYRAFFAMLLPITVHGRVSDIWRSYISQRLFAEVGLSICFAPPAVRQYRNDHNLLADFNSEMHLYERSFRLLQQLKEWRYQPPPTLPVNMSMPAMMEQLYVYLHERGYVGADDVRVMQVWLQALLDVGYEFPTPGSQ